MVNAAGKCVCVEKDERGKERAMMTSAREEKKSKENIGNREGRRNNSRARLCGYPNRNKVRDIRRSRYGNGNEGGGGGRADG